MKKIIFFTPVFYLVLLLFQVERAFTQDLGRHLLLGEIILECFCVPKTNLFSYTAPNFPFINHHWIPEVIFFITTQFAGLNTLLWLKVAVIVSTFITVYFLAVKNSTQWIALIISIPFIFVFSERFDLRPEIFSFLFLAGFLWLFLRYRETKELKYLIPIPFLQVLWVNSHIYFFVGLLLFTFLGIDLLIRKNLNKKFIVVYVLTFMSTLLNPNFLAGAVYPLRVFGNYGYSIVENQNIFFLNSFFFNPRVLVFEILAVASLACAIVHLRFRNYFFAFSVIFSVIAGFVMIRNFPLFVLIAFPAVAAAAHKIRHKVSPEVKKQMLVISMVFTLLFVFIHSFIFISSPYFGLKYMDGAEKAVNFIEENSIKGPIFNNFDIGSYLIYRMYPDEKVFVDGRPEAYPADFFEEYKLMQTDPDYFEQQVKRYNINSIFFVHTDITPWAQEFMRTIIQSDQWIPVYVDEMVIILLRNNLENKDIIESRRVVL